MHVYFAKNNGECRKQTGRGELLEWRTVSSVPSVLAIVDLCREGSIKMKKMFMTSFATQEERRAQAHKSCKIIPYGTVGRETVKLRPNATQNEFQVNAI
jgi:hypothetical protein